MSTQAILHSQVNLHVAAKFRNSACFAALHRISDKRQLWSILSYNCKLWTGLSQLLIHATLRILLFKKPQNVTTLAVRVFIVVFSQREKAVCCTVLCYLFGGISAFCESDLRVQFQAKVEACVCLALAGQESKSKTHEEKKALS